MEIKIYVNIIMTDPPNKSQLFSYRNAHYQGQVKHPYRQGPGILILDQGILLVCNWVNDLPTGRALAFLNHY